MIPRAKFAIAALLVACSSSQEVEPSATDAGSDAGPSCDVGSAAGLVVAGVDLDAFPPYALDGCQLLYVAESGDLLLRNLTNGSESLIAPASEAPRRPAIAGDTLAWEADADGRSVVRVSHAGVVDTPSGAFHHTGEPRATAGAVVFTAWLGALVGGGPHQQRFADISQTHVAYSDFSEDPSGFYVGDGISLADVVLVDRASGVATALPRPIKQAFPMLGIQGLLGYLDWVQVHPVPKLQAYAIATVPLSDPLATPTVVANVESDTRVRPSAGGGWFEWVVRREQTVTLHRAAADTSAAAITIPLDAAELHAPVANDTTTLLAVRPSAGAAPELSAVPR